MYNSLSVGQFLKTSFVDAQGMISSQWARWFNTGLIPAINNSTPKTIPGPFVDDAAANAGGVPIGSAYYQASGAVVVRLT